MYIIISVPIGRHLSSCLLHSHLAVTYRHLLSSLTVNWRLASPVLAVAPSCGQLRTSLLSLTVASGQLTLSVASGHFLLLLSPDCG